MSGVDRLREFLLGNSPAIEQAFDSVDDGFFHSSRWHPITLKNKS
jgi:hypothetical protein